MKNITSKEGFLILGAPTTGKTTVITKLRELNVLCADQDDIAKGCATMIGLLDWIPFKLDTTNRTRLEMMIFNQIKSIVGFGGIVFYSNLMNDVPEADVYLRSHTAVSFARSISSIKLKFIERGTEAPPNIDEWTFDHYSDYSEVSIDLEDNEYITHFINEIIAVLEVQ